MAGLVQIPVKDIHLTTEEILTTSELAVVIWT